MTKTGRIITATLLTIATIGLIIFAVKKPTKPKTLQTKAEDTQLTDITNTSWLLNETIPTSIGTSGTAITFTSNNEQFKWFALGSGSSTTGRSIRYQYTNTNEYLTVATAPWEGTYTFINETYRLINITGGYGATNQDFINKLTSIAYQLPSYTETYITGYNNGYAEGYNNSESFNHPIALQPLMLNILTLPFTFITQAFDVTLWPNTAYEFNIANFIKGLIAVATILFIIKMFTSGFNVIGNYTSQATRDQVNRSQIKLNKAKTEKIKKETK